MNMAYIRQWRWVLQASVASVIWANPVSAALPGTMSYMDVSDERIISTVVEIFINEKHVEFGDYDNDGDLDAAIAVGFSDFGTRRNKLYRNDSGVFVEVSGPPVIDGFQEGDVSRTTLFRDFNSDGWLDLIVLNDHNTGGQGGRTKLYRSIITDGQFERFEQVPPSTPTVFEQMATSGGISFDFNGDGAFDLYSGNMPGPSQDRMFFNAGTDGFQDVTLTRLPDDSDFTVDVAGGDVNGDGKIDILLANANNSLIYYNDDGPNSKGLGDFQYEGSIQELSGASGVEHAVALIDVDSDGDLDIYATNMILLQDRIQLNTGNDEKTNRVIWETLPVDTLPARVLEHEGHQVTVGDLNRDHRDDVFVGSWREGKFGEPLIFVPPNLLRNVTVPGDIRFVDWTPADMDVEGVGGWHGAFGDTDGDGLIDILFGATSGERLYLQTSAGFLDGNEVSGGASFTNHGHQLTVLGTLEIGSEDMHVFTIDEISENGLITLILTAAGDYRLELLNEDDDVLATSDRGGVHVEEVIEMTGIGTRRVRVTLLSGGAGDADADGDVDLNDFAGFQLCFSGPGSHYDYGCLTHDFDADGDVDLADFASFSLGFGQQVSAGQYQLEVLVH
jgi:hypothetical protein